MSEKMVYLAMSDTLARLIEEPLRLAAERDNYVLTDQALLLSVCDEINSQLGTPTTNPNKDAAGEPLPTSARKSRKKAPSKSTDAVAKDVAGKMAKSAKAATESR